MSQKYNIIDIFSVNYNLFKHIITDSIELEKCVVTITLSYIFN